MAAALLSNLAGWEFEQSQDDLRSWTVYDQGGNPIGVVDDVLVDTETRWAEAIVLSDGTRLPIDAIAIGDEAVLYHDTAFIGSLADEREMFQRALEAIERESPLHTQPWRSGRIRLRQRGS